MLNIKNKSCFALGCVSLFFTHAFYAATQPTFSVVPVSANGNNILMSEISNTTVMYRITNNTAISRRLALSPFLSTALSQNTQAVGACNNLFMLQGNGGSCDLSLIINGSQLHSDLTQAPEVCVTLSDGSLTPFLCSKTSQADALFVNKARPYAFIANATTETGTRCTVDPSTGDFSFCEQGRTAAVNLEQIQVTANGRQAYLVDAFNSIQTCAMSVTGEVSDCFMTNAAGLNNPQTITFNTAETHAYITNFNNSTITLCDMNSTTHDLTGCAQTGNVFLNPQGLILNAANTRAYITTYNRNGQANNINVMKCDVSPGTGELDNCVNSGAALAGQTVYGAESIALNAGEMYAYITLKDPQAVMKCDVDASTGNLSACVNQNLQGLNFPAGIAITSDNSFVFIVNASNNEVITCSVSPETGSLTSCKDSGATALALPVSITLR
jgi:DNA-binding beta-propeller fold protein YncE